MPERSRPADDRRLGLGIAGLGRAFMLMLPTLVGHPRLRLAAAADPRPEARARFSAEFSARAYERVEDLCADPAVDAIYVASPHQFHREHVTMAAAAGKHVMVEKPMALTLEECDAMVAATRDAGVALIVGHSHAFDAPYRRARELVAGGAFGPLRMITALNFTDYLYRPRRPEELSTERGGGVVFGQASHQIDVVRLIGGGLLRSVRAGIGTWDPERPAEGAYSAFLTFESGAFGSITYSGYAHFDSDELLGWIGEMGRPRDPAAYGAPRRLLSGARSPQEEAALKAARAYGAGASPARSSEGPVAHNHFGFVVASCERADLRPGPRGVMIDADEARRFEPIPPPVVPRAEVIDALIDTVFAGRPSLHGGEWGRATVEACLALQRSAREGREIALTRQIEATFDAPATP